MLATGPTLQTHPRFLTPEKLMARLKTETVILAILIGIFVGRIPDTFAIKSNAYDFFGTLVDIRSEVVRNYVTEPDHDALLKGAIGGMIESLDDPYTTYLSPKNFQDFDKHTSGTFIGIGAEISISSNIGAELTRDGESLVFGAITSELPAFSAGLMEGDVLTHIDDGTVEGLSPRVAMQRIVESRDDPAITVQRGGQEVTVTITPDNFELTIISPIEGSPALRAGLVSGDVIVEIAGQDTHGKSTSQAIDLIAGPEDTQVAMKVRRLNQTIEDVPITRKRIEVHTVKGFRRNADHSWNHLMDPVNGVGYIRLDQFSDPSTKEIKDAIASLKKQDFKGLIIDLRYNPGGLLNQAIDISEMFLSSGDIVSTNGRNSPKRKWTASDKADVGDFPIVAMVNEGSASAAEILAGALKDNDRAVILGTRSYGKGSVQQVLQLENGAGAIKVTTAHYYLPSGRNIHRHDGNPHWGVDPNDGYYVPVNNRRIRSRNTIRHENDIIRAHYDAPSQSPTTPADLRQEWKDDQLAAALETLTAKITTGEFSKVGQGDAQLQSHMTELASLEQNRDLLVERLHAVDEKIVELRSGIDTTEKEE